LRLRAREELVILTCCCESDMTLVKTLSKCKHNLFVKMIFYRAAKAKRALDFGIQPPSKYTHWLTNENSISTLTLIDPIKIIARARRMNASPQFMITRTLDLSQELLFRIKKSQTFLSYLNSDNFLSSAAICLAKSRFIIYFLNR